MKREELEIATPLFDVSIVIAIKVTVVRIKRITLFLKTFKF